MKEVTGYQTFDGKFFPTYTPAIEHELGLMADELGPIIDSNLDCVKLIKGGVTGYKLEVCDFILYNRIQILEVLEKYNLEGEN